MQELNEAQQQVQQIFVEFRGAVQQGTDSLSTYIDELEKTYA